MDEMACVMFIFTGVFISLSNYLKDVCGKLKIKAVKIKKRSLELVSCYAQ